MEIKGEPNGCNLDTELDDDAGDTKAKADDYVKAESMEEGKEEVEATPVVIAADEETEDDNEEEDDRTKDADYTPNGMLPDLAPST